MIMGWVSRIVGMASGFAFPTWALPVAVAVVVAGFIATVFTYGYSAGQARVQAQKYLEEKMRLERTIAQKDAALRVNDSIAQSQEIEIEGLQRQIEELNRNVENPDSECLDANDTRRLRDVFGGAR
jgi:uncharacterized protein HemX